MQWIFQDHGGEEMRGNMILFLQLFHPLHYINNVHDVNEFYLNDFQDREEGSWLHHNLEIQTN